MARLMRQGYATAFTIDGPKGRAAWQARRPSFWRRRRAQPILAGGIVAPPVVARWVVGTLPDSASSRGPEWNSPSRSSFRPMRMKRCSKPNDSNCRTRSKNWTAAGRSGGFRIERGGGRPAGRVYHNLHPPEPLRGAAAMDDSETPLSSLDPAVFDRLKSQLASGGPRRRWTHSSQN